jgi:hypothetical protein
VTTYRYVGSGRWLVGVPARDLNGDDLARLPDRLRRRLTASGLYVAARPTKAANGRKEVEPDV